MSQSRYYPPLSTEVLKNLSVIRRLLSEDANYLDHAPYTPESKAFLHELFAAVKGTSAHTGPMTIDDISFEVEKLLRDLQGTKAKLTGEENSELMAYFKTATGLLEKILGFRERLLSLKTINDFSSTVLKIMEDVATPDQRTEIMERLEKALKGE